MQIYIIYCGDPILFQLKLNFHSVSLNQSIHKGRKKRSLNVAQLAARIGVSAQAASQWEQGETGPRDENLIKLAEVLNTTPEYIQFGCVNLALVWFKRPGEAPGRLLGYSIAPQRISSLLSFITTFYFGFDSLITAENGCSLRGR